MTYIGFVLVPNVPVSVSRPPLAFPTTSPSLPPNLPFKVLSMSPPITEIIPIFIVASNPEVLELSSAFACFPVILFKIFPGNPTIPFTKLAIPFITHATCSTIGTIASNIGSKDDLNATLTFSTAVLNFSAANTFLASILYNSTSLPATLSK